MAGLRVEGMQGGIKKRIPSDRPKCNGKPGDSGANHQVERDGYNHVASFAW